MCLVLQYFFFNTVGPIVGIIVGAALVVLGGISFADIFRIKIPFSLRRSIERQVLKMIRRTQSYFGGRPTS